MILAWENPEKENGQDCPAYNYRLCSDFVQVCGILLFS